MRPRTGRRGFNDRLQEMNEGRRAQLERIRRIGGVEDPENRSLLTWRPQTFDYLRDNAPVIPIDERAWDSLRALTRSIEGRRITTVPSSTVEIIETPSIQEVNRERLSHISSRFYAGLGVPPHILGMGAQGFAGATRSMSMEMEMEMNRGAFSMLMAGIITLKEYANMQRMDSIKDKKNLTNEEVKFLLEAE